MKSILVMSTTRSNRGLPPPSGNMIQSHGLYPSEGSAISPLMSGTADLTRSPVNPSGSATQQRSIIQSNSGVVRYLFIIED